MKILTDYTPAGPANKYAKDAAEFVDAFKATGAQYGAIEVSTLDTDLDADKVIAREVRVFQDAVLKLGYSARRVEIKLANEGANAEIVFSLKVATPRAPKPADEVELDVPADEPTAKASK
jgi:hypothetical protein